MQRRSFIRNSIGFGIAIHPLVKAWRRPLIDEHLTFSGPAKPVFIYNNWSAYDELSDNVPQTEQLAMNELAQMIRIKRQGFEFDYYVMDAFWFDLWGGYRTWRKDHWPNGPDGWLAACKK